MWSIGHVPHALDAMPMRRCIELRSFKLALPTKPLQAAEITCAGPAATMASRRRQQQAVNCRNRYIHRGKHRRMRDQKTRFARSVNQWSGCVGRPSNLNLSPHARGHLAAVTRKHMPASPVSLSTYCIIQVPAENGALLSGAGASKPGRDLGTARRSATPTSDTITTTMPFLTTFPL